MLGLEDRLLWLLSAPHQAVGGKVAARAAP